MKIKCLQVGPIGTNCYLLCDEDAKTCAVIDSGGDGARIAAAATTTTPALWESSRPNGRRPRCI